MRDFSKVGPQLWDSRKYWSLPDDQTRWVYDYLITSKHVNSSGCYNLKPMYGAADLRWTEEAFRKAIDSIARAGLIEWDGNEATIRITNWFTFNEPTNPKHAMGVLVQLDQASSDRLKLNQLNDLAEFLQAKGFMRDTHLRNALERLSDSYSKALNEGIATKTETKTETEKETKNETKTKIKTETIRTEDTRDGDRDAAPNGASLSPRIEEQKPPTPERIAHLMETPLMRRTAK